jgi:type II secretory pathway component GspD/PulD (secretin)
MKKTYMPVLMTVCGILLCGIDPASGQYPDNSDLDRAVPLAEDTAIPEYREPAPAPADIDVAYGEDSASDDADYVTHDEQILPVEEASRTDEEEDYVTYVEDDDVQRQARGGETRNADIMYSAPFPDKTQTNELISLSLEGVPVADVVSMFARTIEEANIVTGTNDLQGIVTVSVKNVPWEDALTVILDSVGLAKVRNKGNIYTIVSKDELEAAPLDSFVYPLNYMNVEEVLPVAKQLCISEGSGAFAAPGNALVIKETVDRLTRIRAAIAEIDQPREQVFIEAKFVELNAKAREDIGVDWSILQGYKVGISQASWNLTDTRQNKATRTDSRNRYDIWGTQDSVRDLYDNDGQRLTEQEGDTYDIYPNDPGEEVQSVQQDPIIARQYVDTRGRGQAVRSQIENVATKTLDDVKTAILSPADFSLVISALKQNDGTKVVSNPKIVVLNEETATINIGTREPNISTEVITADNQPTRYVSSLDETEPYFQFGITLDVTPTINTASNITVRIEPTLSRFLRDKVAPDNNTFPIRSTKTIKTLFNLASGRTVAIGGLTEVDNNDVEKKVPVLGSIPLLGRLFSHKKKEHTQNETIIFVTVALAEPENMVANEGLPETTKLTRKYMTEQRREDQVFQKEMDVLEINEQIRLREEMEKYRKYLEKLQRKQDK